MGLVSASNVDVTCRLSDELLNRFRRDSFVNLGTLFTPGEVSLVKKAFDRVLHSAAQDIHLISEGGSTETRSVMGWEDADPVLSRFARDSRVMSAVKSVLGERVVFHQTKYNPKGPNGMGERWDPHRGITFWHYLDGVPDPAKMVSVFIALTDQTKENGATYTWKGAHSLSLSDLREETDFEGRREGQMRDDTAAHLSLQIKPEKIAEYDRKFEKIYFSGPAGTVWLLDSRNLHASQQNLSSEVRILVANVFRSVDNHPLHPRDSKFLCNPSKAPLEVYESRTGKFWQ